MAVKTFSSGEVLTASDTNTYLNNGGLVYITQATAGGGAANLIIDGCFTSTYTNYRIVTKFASATSGWPPVYFYMRTGGTDSNTNIYYYMGNGRASNNTDASYATAAASFGYAGSLTGHFVMDVMSPQLSSTQTTFNGQSTFYDGSNFITRSTGNWHNSVASYDGIKFFPGSSTFTNTFTVYVYGYRNS